jgi:hypothetical protein
MDNEVKRQGQQQESDTQKRQGFDKDQPVGSPGQRQPDHSKADDRGNRKETDKGEQAIPDLDEPDVEGVGNEGGTGNKAEIQKVKK